MYVVTCAIVSLATSHVHTPVRRQSKTLILATNADQKSYYKWYKNLQQWWLEGFFDWNMFIYVLWFYLVF